MISTVLLPPTVPFSASSLVICPGHSWICSNACLVGANRSNTPYYIISLQKGSAVVLATINKLSKIVEIHVVLSGTPATLQRWLVTVSDTTDDFSVVYYARLHDFREFESNFSVLNQFIKNSIKRLNWINQIDWIPVVQFGVESESGIIKINDSFIS